MINMSSQKETEQAIKAIALHVKGEMNRLEKEIRSVEVPEELKEKINSLETFLEELKDEMRDVKSHLESHDYSSNIDELKEHKSVISKDVGELKKHVEYIKASSNPERVNKLEGYVKGELSRFDQKLQQATKQDFSKLQQTADELKNKLEQVEIDFSRKTGELDKHVAEAENRIRDWDAVASRKLEEMDRNLEERLGKIEAIDAAIIDKRIGKIEEEINARNLIDIERRMETLEDETKKLEEIRKLLEDESAYRSSLEKKTKELEMKMGGLYKERPSVLESEITPIIARRLEEFARALDRKVPELVTKDEFEQFATNVSNKIRYVEAPDTAAIERRMESVERKLDQLTSVLKDMLDRMPVVVE